MVSKEEADRILADVKGEHHFVLNNGARLKNLHELSAALADMEAGVYVHHVNRERNDFHNWVKDVHKDEILATMVAEANGPLELRSAVLQRLGELEIASLMPETPEPAMQAIMPESVITNPEPIIKNPEPKNIEPKNIGPIALLPEPITKKPEEKKPEKIERKRLVKPILNRLKFKKLKFGKSKIRTIRTKLFPNKRSIGRQTKGPAKRSSVNDELIKTGLVRRKASKSRQQKPKKKNLQASKSFTSVGAFFSDFSKDISKIYSSTGQIRKELASMLYFRKKKK